MGPRRTAVSDTPIDRVHAEPRDAASDDRPNDIHVDRLVCPGGQKTAVHETEVTRTDEAEDSSMNHRIANLIPRAWTAKNEIGHAKSENRTGNAQISGIARENHN